MTLASGRFTASWIPVCCMKQRQRPPGSRCLACISDESSRQQQQQQHHVRLSSAILADRYYVSLAIVVAFPSVVCLLSVTSGGASYGAKGLKPPQILLKPPQIFV